MHRPSRRRWLSKTVLGLGLIARMAAPSSSRAAASPAQGVISIRGSARINGSMAAAGMAVKAGDEIVTAAGTELTLVVGRDAMLMRANTRVKLVPAASGNTYLLRVFTGAVLAVFEPGAPKQLRTPTAVIGIRGTAAYVAAERDRTYVCICYGTAHLSAVDDPQAAETVSTRHHDEPRYIYRRGMPTMMEVAPVVNHSDDELAMLEALVGRRPAFTRKY